MRHERLWQLSCCSGRAEWLWQTTVNSTKPKIFSIWSFTEKVCQALIYMQHSSQSDPLRICRTLTHNLSHTFYLKVKAKILENDLLAVILLLKPTNCTVSSVWMAFSRHLCLHLTCMRCFCPNVTFAVRISFLLLHLKLGIILPPKHNLPFSGTLLFSIIFTTGHT